MYLSDIYHGKEGGVSYIPLSSSVCRGRNHQAIMWPIELPEPPCSYLDSAEHHWLASVVVELLLQFRHSGSIVICATKHQAVRSLVQWAANAGATSGSYIRSIRHSIQCLA